MLRAQHFLLVLVVAVAGSVLLLAMQALPASPPAPNDEHRRLPGPRHPTDAAAAAAAAVVAPAVVKPQPEPQVAAPLNASALVCENGAAVVPETAVYTVAAGVIGGRKEGGDEYIRTVRATWLSHLPFATVFLSQLFDGARKNQPQDFVEVLHQLKAEFPGAPWYYISDDDTMLHVRNLLCLTAGKDATLPHAIGVRHCQGEQFICAHGQIELTLGGWLNGGAGVLLSGELARRMDTEACTRWYSQPHHWEYGQVAADVVLSCCVGDYWRSGRLTHHPGFIREPPGPRQMECECDRFSCTLGLPQARSRPFDIMSYHHVSTSEITALHQRDVARWPAFYSRAPGQYAHQVQELYE